MGKTQKGRKQRRRSKTNDTAKSLAILISGKFNFHFPETDKEICLDKEGDYIYYESKTPHAWEAVEDSLILTIRWPSLANDQK